MEIRHEIIEILEIMEDELVANQGKTTENWWAFHDVVAPRLHELLALLAKAGLVELAVQTREAIE